MVRLCVSHQKSAAPCTAYVPRESWLMLMSFSNQVFSNYWKDIILPFSPHDAKSSRLCFICVDKEDARHIDSPTKSKCRSRSPKCLCQSMHERYFGALVSLNLCRVVIIGHRWGDNNVVMLILLCRAGQVRRHLGRAAHTPRAILLFHCPAITFYIEGYFVLRD